MNKFEVQLSIDKDGDCVVTFSESVQSISFSPSQLFKFATRLGVFSMYCKEHQEKAETEQPAETIN